MSQTLSASKNKQGISLQGVDPETCTIVFKNHWAQVQRILEKHDPFKNLQAKYGAISPDEVSAVQNYVEYMLLLLIEEQVKDAAMGPILEFVVSENIMEKLFLWSLRREFTDETKFEQLKMYELLVTQSHQPLLHHKPILKPLMMLLSTCSGTSTPSVEKELVVLLNQLCLILAKDPSILELFFHTSEDQGAANFLIFSLLIPFIHREGTVGQQARDALLFIMSLSAENNVVATHIVESTYFCPVTVEEVMTTTAYLDLFLRSVSEPTLLKIFLHFILIYQHESVHILDTLVSRINTPFRLCVVSLALFRTLIGLHCEDAMLQLILRYLIPCNHMMVSQRWAVRERDCYSASAARFLALTPLGGSSGITVNSGNMERNYILWSKFTEQTGVDESKQSSSSDEPRSPLVVECGNVVDASYLQYLWEAHDNILKCVQDTKVWSAPYDGENPDPDSSFQALMEENFRRGDFSTFRRANRPPMNSLSPETPSLGGRIQLELEWDDSYDTGMSPESGESSPQPSAELGNSSSVLPPEPPKHIQEMKTNAIMFIKGSYIEESDFQDDVMVYRLCALKDAQDSNTLLGENKDMSTKSKTQVQGPDTKEQQTPAQKGKEIEVNNIKNSSLNQDAAMEQVKQKRAHKDLPKLELQLSSAADYNSDAKTLSPDSEDFIARCDEIINGLNTNSLEECRSPAPNTVSPMEEEEDEFEKMSLDTPPGESVASPFGPKDAAIIYNHSARSQAAPFTGPFVSVVLSKLENMLENSLHVNLLLAGIITQLATYPQPLIRSFLLNTNMVFQPSIRSLYQVLACVKHKIEQFAATENNFPMLVAEAQQYLLSRMDMPEASVSTLTKDNIPKNVDTDNRPNVVEVSQTVLQTNKEQIAKASRPLPGAPVGIRNAVFAAVLFPEFLKELAALAQEHSVLDHVMGDSVHH
ncbi:FHF complex subunit HOOK-interacting protein 1A isoform X3 [Ascaphus truei]|uniref:FHF complex subunit HOOK-interacting protein 1A isoform X3 n=1 Tax=Ascaphus truei TaxID=8439 RepID=UPI003F59B9D9